MTGYKSKKAAARDKLDDDDTQVYQDHDDTLTIAYQSGYYDGKKAAAQSAQEPVEYQMRMRPTWEVTSFSDWKKCNRDAFDDYTKTPKLHDWEYEVRKLYTTPPQPAQEPVAWADLQKEAQQIVESKFLWKKFIDGTPLSNDIACWMADFAQQYTAPPQPAQEPVANDRALQLVTYQMNHWRAYALELQERLVKYEGGAPMLLNKEKNT